MATPILDALRSHKNAIRQFGVGLAQGHNISEGLGYGAQGIAQGAQADDAYGIQQAAEAKRQEQLQAAVENMRKYAPDIADIVQSGGMDPQTGWNETFKRMSGGEQPKPMEINGQLVNPTDGSVIGDYRTPEAPKTPTAPTGYQFGPDGQSLQFIPGGPADPSTAGKTTEATRRNQQLATVIAPELESLIPSDGSQGTYDALANGWDQAKGMVPGTNSALASPEYQQAQNSLKTIVASYLYSVSGATANPGEVQTQVDVLTPKPGESAQSVAAKKARVVQMVNAVKAAATGTPISVPGAPTQGNAPTSYVYNPATGELEPQ